MRLKMSMIPVFGKGSASLERTVPDRVILGVGVQGLEEPRMPRMNQS